MSDINLWLMSDMLVLSDINWYRSLCRLIKAVFFNYFLEKKYTSFCLQGPLCSKQHKTNIWVANHRPSLAVDFVFVILSYRERAHHVECEVMASCWPIHTNGKHGCFQRCYHCVKERLVSAVCGPLLSFASGCFSHQDTGVLCIEALANHLHCSRGSSGGWWKLVEAGERAF